MKSRGIIVGWIVLVAVVASASAFELSETTSLDIGGTYAVIRGIPPEMLTDKQDRNRRKALDRFVIDGNNDDTAEFLGVLRRAAKPLAKAVDGTPYQGELEKGIIGILVGVRSDLNDIADNLQDRGHWEDLGGPYSLTLELSDKKSRKLAGLLGRARLLIDSNGGNDTVQLVKNGKDLKRQAVALLGILKKLRKVDRGLRNAGR